MRAHQSDGGTPRERGVRVCLRVGERGGRGVFIICVFEKTKALRLILNIATGLILFASVIPIHDRLNPAGLGALWAGALLYASGLVFFRLGKTRRYAHTVFHLFVLAGSAVHAYAMVVYIFKLS